MKISKIIMPITGLATIPAVAIPLAGCSCSTTKVLDLSNGTFPGKESQKIFCLSGNFNKGTSYTFRANLKNWTTDYGKPSETEYKTWTNVSMSFVNPDGEVFALADTDNIKVFLDGKELTKGTTTGQWGYDVSDDGKMHIVGILNSQASPVGYNSTIEVQNIKFTADTSAVAILNTLTD